MTNTQPVEPSSPVDYFAECGRVPVDSGHILIVDPCNIPPDVLHAITSPNAAGITVAVVVQTPSGDGSYPVDGSPGSLTVYDPYACDDADDDPRPGGGWGLGDGPALADLWRK
jgi:hypothetical protein